MNRCRSPDPIQINEWARTSARARVTGSRVANASPRSSGPLLLKIVGNVFSWWLFARPNSLEWGWAMGVIRIV